MGEPTREEVWRPIATAPTDGRPILGAVIDHSLKDGYLLVEVTRWVAPRMSSIVRGWEIPGSFSGEVMHGRFTHWMPLPPPPGEGDGGRGADAGGGA